MQIAESTTQLDIEVLKLRLFLLKMHGHGKNLVYFPTALYMSSSYLHWIRCLYFDINLSYHDSPTYRNAHTLRFTCHKDQGWGPPNWRAV